MAPTKRTVAWKRNTSSSITSTPTPGSRSRSKNAKAVREYRERERKRKEELDTRIDGLKQENLQMRTTISGLEAQLRLFAALMEAHDKASDGRFSKDLEFTEFFIDHYIQDQQ